LVKVIHNVIHREFSVSWCEQKWTRLPTSACATSLADKPPIADPVATLLKLKGQGKIRAFGEIPLHVVPTGHRLDRRAARCDDVLAGGRNLQQVTEDDMAGDLKLEAGDWQRIRQDVVNLGEPARS